MNIPTKNFTIDHNSKLPLHVQVEELFRKLIKMEAYKKGALLPKEVDLANLWGVSRNTIRQATNKLEHEGLITRKKGVGTRVAEKKSLVTGLDHWYSFTREMQEKGISVVNQSLKTEYAQPNEMICNFFNCTADKRVFKLSKLKGEDSGDPIVYFESYFHPRIDIKQEDDFNTPLYSMLQENYGVVVHRSRENISACQAGTVIGKKLKVASAFPLLKRERFVYDINGKPVEYNVGYYRSDKFTYTIDINKSMES
ncbi:GntR family transcriptional regulator [Elizabethkingia meningoseptica]|uniref:GntR family transcriptional regulator n=2 Tax=Elizabethkingia meningoseptica TaxID=238 RepID=A0A1V3TVG4_ELIME|nr:MULTISPECIES: GntR family transcriptional regulator [Elizabethkingia]AQX12096.1 GntR family transcriptional regulator [Elizabethkingia meningoseptica]EJK5328414.1 GntR family transcriptional regulator [Elizabethkingia meningoseptica]MBG0513568.1 GntR family transcriptional regulator [Elizabethkingia meningoseptica]MCL1676723.1 GntR family transcriptional regulator [Elizabethkingia meningoseptica]MCL1686672.1 GntR family transcriptional regulator [Elizabethkingia meningoseptica]